MTTTHIATVLADYVFQDSEGKYAAMGIFHQILASKKRGPIVHPLFHLLSVVYVEGAIDDTPIEFWFRDEAGTFKIRIGEVRIKPEMVRLAPGSGGLYTIHIVCPGLQFPHFGLYWACVDHDSREIHRAPFALKEKPE